MARTSFVQKSANALFPQAFGDTPSSLVEGEPSQIKAFKAFSALIYLPWIILKKAPTGLAFPFLDYLQQEMEEELDVSLNPFASRASTT